MSIFDVSMHAVLTKLTQATGCRGRGLWPFIHLTQMIRDPFPGIYYLFAPQFRASWHRRPGLNAAEHWMSFP